METDKQIGRILLGYQPAMILMAANQLGIFDQITGLPVQAAKVAQQCHLSTEATERLLNVLCALGIVQKTNQQYHLPADFQKFLTQRGEQSMQHWIQFNADQIPVWEQLPEYIRSGNPLRSFMELVGEDPEVRRGFIDGMHTKGMRAIWLIAREIPIGEAHTMLDVGGGPGTFSLEWAKLHTHLKGTVFDIPPVVEIAREYIQQYGLEDRIQTRAGDFTKDDLGSGYDLALLANILHMYDADTCRKVIQKAVDGLEPGGRIILHGFGTEEDQTGPIEDSLFNLGVALFTPGGAAHPIQHMTRWLKEAGIPDARSFRIPASPSAVITGIKPV